MRGIQGPKKMWSKMNIVAPCWRTMFSCMGSTECITVTSNERHVVSNHQSFYCLFDSLCGPTPKKHQSPRYWPFVSGIHRWPVNSPHKGPVPREKLPFDDVIMGVPHCTLQAHQMRFRGISFSRFHENMGGIGSAVGCATSINPRYQMTRLL